MITAKTNSQFSLCQIAIRSTKVPKYVVIHTSFIVVQIECAWLMAEGSMVYYNRKINTQCIPQKTRSDPFSMNYDSRVCSRIWRQIFRAKSYLPDTRSILFVEKGYSENTISIKQSYYLGPLYPCCISSTKTS